jgi:hypothetical protein
MLTMTLEMVVETSDKTAEAQTILAVLVVQQAEKEELRAV